MMRRFSPLLLILLIPGCLTSGQLGDTPRPPTPTPLLDASGQPIPELEVTGQALPAGTYTRDVFEPRIVLDLNGDWEAVQLLEGFFDVQQFKESPDVYAVQFANPTNVDTAEEAVASLRENADLTELESSTSLIDGQEGLQITVENISGATTPIFDRTTRGPRDQRRAAPLDRLLRHRCGPPGHHGRRLGRPVGRGPRGRRARARIGSHRRLRQPFVAKVTA